MNDVVWLFSRAVEACHAHGHWPPPVAWLYTGDDAPMVRYSHNCADTLIGHTLTAADALGSPLVVLGWSTGREQHDRRLTVAVLDRGGDAECWTRKYRAGVAGVDWWQPEVALLPAAHEGRMVGWCGSPEPARTYPAGRVLAFLAAHGEVSTCG